MYQLPYAEILDDDSQEARRREREAFDLAISMLEDGEAAGARSVVAIKALYFSRRLWMILLEDLAHDDNGLPEKLRAGLISIGIWILKECGRVENGTVESLHDLIEINIIVRNGLK